MAYQTMNTTSAGVAAALAVHPRMGFLLLRNRESGLAQHGPERSAERGQGLAVEKCKRNCYFGHYSHSSEWRP
jgi:hypothetical protein